jgi:hypothetical protein
MRVPLMVWYPPAAPLPDMPLVPDLAVGAWLALALLVSGALLLWSIVRWRDFSNRVQRWVPRPRPRLRSVDRRHALPGRP